MDGPPSLPSPLLLGALDAARRGWRAFPLHWLPTPGVCSCPKGAECKGSAGKHPLHGGWQGSATTDPEKILATWTEYPRAHVGITTGRGLVVLDVDPRHDGPATLARLCAEHGQLPETFTVQSGGGGPHHYFRTTELLKNTTGAKTGLPGLDTRGDGGLVVYPPSPHLSGGVYQILRDVPPAPFPTWLRDRVYGVTPGTIAARIVASGKKPATTIPTTFEDGDRDNLVMRLAASLRAKGMDEEEIFAGLLVPNERRCKPPLPESDLRRIAASMAKYTPGTAARVKKPVLQEAAPPAVEPAPGDPPAPDDWIDRLTKTERNGTTVAEGTPANAVTALGHHPGWTGVLRWNLFREAVDVCGVAPWHADDAPAEGLPAGREWTDTDDARLVNWLEREIGIRVKRGDASDAVAIIARRRAYHPVRDYLDGLAWDRVPRLGIFLAAYFGASGQPPAYLAAIGSKWLISAVARIYRPGVQADHVPILEGIQGAGKTTGGAALVPDPEWFFTLGGQDVGGVESQRKLRGRWLVELGELDALSRTEVSRSKQFVSESADTYRDPYARRAVKFPRQNVFLGTVNPDGHGYLRDITGNRRFWPVACGAAVDVAGLARDRDQLWAEARDLFRAGTIWHPGRDETALLATLDEEQRDRLASDPWENHLNAFLARKIAAWCADPKLPRHVTLDDLLGAVGKARSDWTRADETRAGAIAIRALWTSVRPRGTGGVKVRQYLPPSSTVWPTSP